MPLGILFMLCVLYFSIKKEHYKKVILRVIIGLSILFTNGFIANEIIKRWELEPLPFQEITDQYEYGVVLTGVANNEKMPKDRVYFNKGADRVTHTIMLYNRGIIHKILISGGTGSLRKVDYREADQLKNVFVELGVPDSLIVLENNSKNTYESARHVKQILKEKNQINQKILLITSSFHMRRARGCFVKAGMETDIFPVDFYSGPTILSVDSIIPNSDALKKWSVVMHEVTGIIAYKMMGMM